MRVFICFEGSWESFDVPPNQTVGATKQMVKDYFHVQLSDDNQVRHFLELSCAGATLQDSWILCDVGITAGSAIRCLIKTEQKPVISVFNAVTGETLPIMESVSLLHDVVSRLKTIVSLQSGLPVSAFRLCSPAGVQMFDCNQLRDYDIVVGTTVRLDTWDGWVEFLRACFAGHRLAVQSHLVEEKSVMRFQLRVALYIASFAGHLDLADWLLERGIRAVDPVGVHPYRHWCHQTSHEDTRKCPVHVAAENNQLLILKLFVAKNLQSLACRDPGGRDPLKIAIQHGHRECVSYLANRLFSVVSLPNISLPVRVFLQMRRWAALGQMKSSGQGRRASSGLGDTMLVDGFTKPKMSSKSRKSHTRSPSRGLAALARRHRAAPSNGRSSGQSDKGASLQTPRLRSVHSADETARLDRGRMMLPPLCPDPSRASSASLETFSRLAGRTPRENAVYCMAVASAFTERPWQKQLSVARTLIRKSFQTSAG